MTKAELIETLYKKFDGEVTKRMTGEMLDAVFDTIARSIKKKKRFSYPGFGTFLFRKRNKRKGRNPQTGEVIDIKASKTVGFRAAKALKARL